MQTLQTPPSQAFERNDLAMFEGENEPRVRDVALGKKLGLSRARDVRAVIERSRESMSALGEVRGIGRKPTTAGGRPGKEYWLTERQALFIIARTETPAAAAVTVQMVEVFHAYRTQTAREVEVMPQTPDHGHPPPARLRVSPARIAASKMRFASAVMELDMMGIDYTTFDPKIVLGFARFMGKT